MPSRGRCSGAVVCSSILFGFECAKRTDEREPPLCAQWSPSLLLLLLCGQFCALLAVICAHSGQRSYTLISLTTRARIFQLAPRQASERASQCPAPVYVPDKSISIWLMTGSGESARCGATLARARARAPRQRARQIGRFHSKSLSRASVRVWRRLCGANVAEYRERERAKWRNNAKSATYRARQI